MRRFVCALALLATSAGAAAAQGYDVTQTTGDHDFLFVFRQQASLAFGPPQDNALSEWQPLPFPWTFFGEDVAGYFISDNGYITFDRSARTSVGANTALPDAAAPTLALFAFWTDLKMESGHGQWVNSVWNATLGAAPNRVHVIYFMSLVPKADSFSAAAFDFAVALHEGGDFEVIFTSGRKATPVKATVGALSADGTRAVMAAGPAFDFPNVGYGGADDLSFRFRPVPKK